jgi:hypothetical protein
MSNRSIDPTPASKRTSISPSVGRLQSSGKPPPDVAPRLRSPERSPDRGFRSAPTDSGVPIPATAPGNIVVVSNAAKSITRYRITVASETASAVIASSSSASATAAPANTALPFTDTLVSGLPPATSQGTATRPAVEQSSTTLHLWTASRRRTDLWRGRAEILLESADALRFQFHSTQKATTPGIQKANRKVVYSERALCQLVDSLLSARRPTCIHFNSVTRTLTLPTVLARVRHVPIKLDASGAGRERFLNEVLPAMAKINTNCPVVLVARKNGLRPRDIQALVDVMNRNAVVYRLDLSENLLCMDEEPCLPLVELFRVVGPTSHVYLSDCGVNGETARQIADALPANPCITHLDLRRNAIDATAAVELAQAAGLCSALAALRLQGNEFDEEDDDVTLAVEAANRLHANRSDDEEVAIRLPVVQTSAVDAETMLNESMRTLVQQLLDAAALREQL